MVVLTNLKWVFVISKNVKVFKTIYYEVDLLSLWKTSTKPGVNLYNRPKIQIFITVVN